MFNLKILIYFFGFMHLVGVHANEPNQSAQYSSLLYENMSIYEDNSQKLTIKDIKSLPLKGFKRINNKKQLFFNHKIQNYWLKIELSKNIGIEENLVIYPLNFVSEFELYVFDKEMNLLSSDRTGINITKSENAKPYGRYGIDIHLKKNQTHILYLKVKPFYLSNIAIELISNKKYQNLTIGFSSFWGFFYGSLMIILFYNIFSYYSTKDTIFIDYILFNIFGIIHSITFFTPLQAATNNFYYSPHEYMNITIVLFTAAGINLIRKCLDIRTLEPKLNEKYKVIIGLYYVALIPMSFLSSGDAAYLGEPLVLFSIFYVLYTIIRYFNLKDKGTLFLVVANISTIVGTLLLVANSVFNYLSPELLDLIAPVSMLCQTFLLTTSLIIKISDIKDKTTLNFINNEKVLNLKVEEQTKQILISEKFSAVGRMARGVAHEINNPLMIMQGNIRKTKRIVKEESDAYIPLSKIDQSLNRVALVVNSFLDLAETSENSNFESISISIFFKMIETSKQNCIVLLENENISLDICNNINDDKISIEGNEDNLNRVITTIIQNSIDSIVKSTEKTDNKINIVLDMSNDGKSIIVKIIDSGNRPSLEVQSQMFEPFFTTKILGESLGMSLPLAKNIIQNHNGKLEYLDEIENTTFELSLPKAA